MSRFDLVPLAKILLSDVSKFSAVPAQLSQAFTNGATSLWYALPSSGTVGKEVVLGTRDSLVRPPLLCPQHTYLTLKSF
jgi:hypothetical protein